jgi:hypothetical protein
MCHERIMARLWSRADIPTTVQRIVELGAGDGTFCLKLFRRLNPSWRIPRVTLVDRTPSVTPTTRNDFEALGCELNVIRADVFDWLQTRSPATVIFANLFLHHFRDDELAGLLDGVMRSSRVFLAVEPARCGMPLLVSRCLGLIGCNEVTRHDAPVSVRAGFADSELRQLWPDANGWKMEEGRAGWFSHSFLARRNARPVASVS